MILAATHGDPLATATATATAAVAAANGASHAAITSAATPDELAIAGLLQHIWFSCLIGWTGGLMNQNEVLERMGSATSLLLRATSHNHNGK